MLCSYSQLFIAKSKEIQQLCRILLQLYRCSDERVRASFCLDGSTLIITLLEVIEINYRLGKKGDTKCLVLAQNVVDKLINLARAPLALVKSHNSLLSTLISYINGATGKIAMYHSMKCIASLSEHTQNKQALLTFPNLMESVELGARHMYEAVRQESARIMFNLAMETKNKARLAKRNKQCWMDVVLALTTEKESSIESKAYAINTLGHLATETENKIIMVQHKNGFIVNVLLQIARHIDLESSSIETLGFQVSVNAAKIIGNLTCRATASRVGNHPGLLATLSSLACRNDKLAVMAAMTVKKLATHIRSQDPCHPHLLRALVTMTYGKATEVLKWTVKAYAEQASFPHDRVEMIAHKGLLPALTMLTDDNNNTVRGYAHDVLGVLAGKKMTNAIFHYYFHAPY